MKKGLFDRRIPTIVALLVLLFVVGISTILVQTGVFYIGKAAPDTNPQNFSISNITDTSFTVIFTTAGLVEGTVALTNSDTGNTISLDDRDKKTGVKNKYFSHHITIQNLKPKTSYSFKLLVGSDEYENQSYTTTTGVTIESPPPAQNPIYGRVLNPDGTQDNDAIVSARTESSSLITAHTTQKGEFILPTNSLRNIQHDGYIILSENTEFDISAIKQNMKTSVKASFKISQNLPPITLLQEYVFTPNIKPTQTPIATGLDAGISSGETDPLSITTPREDESFTDLKPLFEGTALPEQTVNLSVSGVFSQQVLANVVGYWSFRPSVDFPPGKYTLLASSKNSLGDTINASSNFSIFPQGSQVLADSLNPTTTPTSAPTPTSSPTPTPLPSSTPTPIQSTPIPTAQVSPTAVPETPAPTLLPTIPITPTQVPPIESPGFLDNTYFLTGISILLIIAGSAILFVL